MSHQNKHIFAICAYQESPFLEECVRSVLDQTVPTKVIIATATPNAHIREIADRYQIPVYVNTGEHGITQDWNFAYANADADYVTIAHQDDRYAKTYVENLLACMKKTRKPLIFFTDYAELRNGKIVSDSRLLKIKRILLLPLRRPSGWRSRFWRRRSLSLGTAICCPSVSFVKDNLPDTVFQHHFQADEDWEAWERLSRLDGEFVFCPKILTYHRIHGDSETSRILQSHQRETEDYEMFCRFWPKWIARILTKLYKTSEKSNDLGEQV